MTKAQRKENLMPAGIPRYVRVYHRENNEFTVVYTGRYKKYIGWFDYVGMNNIPFDSLYGICQHGQSRGLIDVNKWGFPPAIGRKNHLGTRIAFNELPEDCKKVVIEDYKEIWNV